MVFRFASGHCLSKFNQTTNVFQENFGKQEQDCERQYNDLVWLLEQRHDESMQSLGEEKKEKLEALYEKLVNCGENLDTCKELIETIEDLGQGKDKADTIKVSGKESRMINTSSAGYSFMACCWGKTTSGNN